MLVGGFDGLVSAALTMVGVAVLLLTLDLHLGAVCLVCFPVVLALVRWFSGSSARTYRRVRETSAMTIVHFVETMTGIRAVQSYRRERRNQEIFEDVSDRYSEANVDAFRLVAIFMPSTRLVGNLTIGIVLLYGGYRVIEGDMTVGVLAAFSALSADVLRADAGDQPVLQHLPVGVRRTREAVRSAGGGARGDRADGPGAAAGGQG